MNLQLFFFFLPGKKGAAQSLRMNIYTDMTKNNRWSQIKSACLILYSKKIQKFHENFSILPTPAIVCLNCEVLCAGKSPFPYKVAVVCFLF